MNGWDWVITAALGYLSVLLVSLATRKKWPDALKFLVALGVAIGAAVLQVWARGDALTKISVLTALGITFPAQQLTWHLQLPGAGTPDVNEALLSVGDPVPPSGG